MQSVLQGCHTDIIDCHINPLGLHQCPSLSPLHRMGWSLSNDMYLYHRMIWRQSRLITVYLGRYFVHTPYTCQVGPDGPVQCHLTATALVAARLVLPAYYYLRHTDHQPGAVTLEIIIDARAT